MGAYYCLVNIDNGDVFNLGKSFWSDSLSEGIGIFDPTPGFNSVVQVDAENQLENKMYDLLRQFNHGLGMFLYSAIGCRLTILTEEHCGVLQSKAFELSFPDLSEYDFYPTFGQIGPPETPYSYDDIDFGLSEGQIFLKRRLQRNQAEEQEKVNNQNSANERSASQKILEDEIISKFRQNLVLRHRRDGKGKKIKGKEEVVFLPGGSFSQRTVT
jgi:hypothetical protein